jgi:phosphoglycolate phosphatase
MIGDTIYDIKGAKEHGLDTIAVNYGYGKTQDLKDSKPTYLVESVEELRSILLA